jgi:hypothetical protein
MVCSDLASELLQVLGAWTKGATNKKPARRSAPNDYLSLSRSKPNTWPVSALARRSEDSASNRNHACEKGRAGGRARRPARPLAGEPVHGYESTVASGVDACKSRHRAFVLFFFARLSNNRVKSKPNARSFRFSTAGSGGGQGVPESSPNPA